MRASDDLTLAVAHDLFVGDVDSERVQLLDDRLGARDSLLGKILQFHVQGEVRRVAEVAEDMDVLAFPYGRNFDAGDDFEPDFLGGFDGEVVAIQVIVVGDGYAAQTLAFAKRKQFLDRKVAVRELGVHVEVRIPATFGNDGRKTFLHH